MKFNLKETSIMQDYCLKMLGIGYEIDEKDAYMIAEMIIYTIAEFLSARKVKDHPIVACINNKAGSAMFAAVAEWQQNEEDEEKSSWYIWMTLYDKDIKELENAEVFPFTNGEVQAVLSNVSKNKFNVQFTGPLLEVNQMGQLLFQSITKWLDVNADPKETKSVEDNLFTLRVGVENDIKLFDIVPGEDIKKTISKTPMD